MASGCGYFQTRYLFDTGLVETPFRRFWCAVGVVALLAFPFAVPSFWVSMANLTAIAAIGALALNLLTGYAGQLSLGTGGFLAAGAFTCAALVQLFGAPVWVTLPASLLVGALLGVIVGVPALRLRGVYLAASTLAAHFVIIALASEYQSHVGRGAALALPAPSIFGWELRGDRAWYFVLLLLATLITIVCVNLTRSHVGRAWLMLRERDLAAAALGIDIRLYKIMAFVISTALTSLAGALTGYYTGFVGVEAFGFLVTVQYLAMIVVGGMGSILGCIYGAAFVMLLPVVVERGLETVPFGGGLESQLFAVQGAVFAVVMIVFLLREPRGLVALWLRVRTYFELWPFRHRPLHT
jgi:branched-chain amino acid transport system permease protein